MFQQFVPVPCRPAPPMQYLPNAYAAAAPPIQVGTPLQAGVPSIPTGVMQAPYQQSVGVPQQMTSRMVLPPSTDVQLHKHISANGALAAPVKELQETAAATTCSTPHSIPSTSSIISDKASSIFSPEAKEFVPRMTPKQIVAKEDCEDSVSVSTVTYDCDPVLFTVNTMNAFDTTPSSTIALCYDKFAKILRECGPIPSNDDRLTEGFYNATPEEKIIIVKDGKLANFLDKHPCITQMIILGEKKFCLIEPATDDLSSLKLQKGNKESDDVEDKMKQLKSDAIIANLHFLEEKKDWLNTKLMETWSEVNTVFEAVGDISKKPQYDVGIANIKQEMHRVDMIVEQSKEILLNGSTELPDLKYSTPEIPNCLTLKYLAEKHKKCLAKKSVGSDKSSDGAPSSVCAVTNLGDCESKLRVRGRGRGRGPSAFIKPGGLCPSKEEPSEEGHEDKDEHKTDSSATESVAQVSAKERVSRWDIPPKYSVAKADGEVMKGASRWEVPSNDSAANQHGRVLFDNLSNEAPSSSAKAVDAIAEASLELTSDFEKNILGHLAPNSAATKDTVSSVIASATNRALHGNETTTAKTMPSFHNFKIDTHGSLTAFSQGISQFIRPAGPPPGLSLPFGPPKATSVIGQPTAPPQQKSSVDNQELKTKLEKVQQELAELRMRRKSEEETRNVAAAKIANAATSGSDVTQRNGDAMSLEDNKLHGKIEETLNEREAEDDFENGAVVYGKPLPVVGSSIPGVPVNTFNAKHTSEMGKEAVKDAPKEVSKENKVVEQTAVKSRKTSDSIRDSDIPFPLPSSTKVDSDDAWKKVGKKGKVKTCNFVTSCALDSLREAPPTEASGGVKSLHDALLSRLEERYPSSDRSENLRRLDAARKKLGTLRGKTVQEILDVVQKMDSGSAERDVREATPPEKSIMYKSKLCEFFQLGRCHKENSCVYAHGKEELRYDAKAIFCTKLQSPAGCDHGTNCLFAHSREEQKHAEEMIKKQKSTNFSSNFTMKKSNSNKVAENLNSFMPSYVTNEMLLETSPTQDSNAKECPICLMALVTDRETLVCGHEFHRECVNLWLAQDASCPICRTLSLNEEEFPALHK